MLQAPTPPAIPVAAAPRLLCSTAQLEHALLLYFSQQYEDAWMELGCVLQVPACCCCVALRGWAAAAADRRRLHALRRACRGGHLQHQLHCPPPPCLLPQAARSGGSGDSEAAEGQQPLEQEPALGWEDLERLEVLIEKCRLQLAFAAS